MPPRLRIGRAPWPSPSASPWRMTRRRSSSGSPAKAGPTGSRSCHLPRTGLHRCSPSARSTHARRWVRCRRVGRGDDRHAGRQRGEAGCKPELFPLIVTAVKAILSKPFNLYGIQGTTNPASPVLIVNGPIAREIGINGRGNLFGPGFRANATIGRAIRLIMTTIGGGVPQQADKSTLGNPAKYTCCFAENDADNPWAPLHVERGFEAETSTVTAFGGAAPANIIEKSKTANEMLETIARAVAVSGSNNMFMSQEALIVLGPEHASLAAKQGFDKQRVRLALFEHARIPFEQIGQSNADVLSVWRGNCIEERDGRRSLRIVERPDDIIVVVAGGAGNHSASIPGWYSRSVTLPLLRADGAPLRSVAELKKQWVGSEALEICLPGCGPPNPL